MLTTVPNLDRLLVWPATDAYGGEVSRSKSFDFSSKKERRKDFLGRYKQGTLKRPGFLHEAGGILVYSCTLHHIERSRT